jgi:hypothetical protein
MPQLDILLFSSQSFSGMIFISGFLYFSKILFPYISFFVKFDGTKIVYFFEGVNTLLIEQSSVNGSRRQNLLVLKYIST